ncbi:hypothetical protein CAEBREN_04882 [Caenorhabditis brenneri]|uniref:Uncharacterized protein n=1 Tax=Caenorhabditis brenneri TaxID=135651 RepID=G0P222_CAEBE|nr:hypothetical protein CAEBREN_04882 [Caenorhabditis brenneri]
MDQEAKKEENAVSRKKFWMQWIPLVKGERRYNYTEAWDPFMVRFTEKLVPFKVAEKAMEALYVNCTMELGDDGLTPLEDMKAQFHFITEERHIEKLRKMKREGIKCCREHMKFFIGLEMEIETEKRIAKGEALNMKQYLEMFKRIRTDHEIPDYIKANKKWVEQWKKEMEEESKKRR